MKAQVLCIIRWPVGGIRTWCKYVYSHSGFREFRLTVAAPSGELTDLLSADLAGGNVRIIPLPDQTGRFIRHVQSLITSTKWSLIHSHGFTAAATTALGSLGYGIPHLVTQHDLILDNQFRGFKGALQRGIVSAALRAAGVVHSVSQSAARNLVHSFPWLEANPGKLVVITNGIDSGRFLRAQRCELAAELHLDKDDFLVGFFGRFMSPKGFRYLVDAVRILRTAHYGMRRPVVVCAGDGGFFQREKRAIQALELEDSFRFVPFAPDLGPLIKAMDVVAMPSLWEACGLVAMETMASGVPLICSDCDALVEITDDSPAVIVPKANGPALTATLLAETSNPSKNAAAAFAETAAARFDVSQAAGRMTELYARMAFDR